MKLNIKHILSYLLLFCTWLGFSCKEEQSHFIPSIKIYVKDGTIRDDKKIRCEVSLTDQEKVNHVNAKIEYRGSSSSIYPKKSYSIHFKNEKEIQLNGLNVLGEWVLYAPYADRTCIRNKFAEYLYRKMGHKSTKSLYVDLYMNDQYKGLYELRQKINLKNLRLNQSICILKIDKNTGRKRESTHSFVSPETKIEIHDIAPLIKSKEAFDHIHNFENALLNRKSHLESFIDLNSFVDYFLFSEFANSPDAYRSSCYFQVLKDGRIAMGPVWDYDLAFGNSTLLGSLNTFAWRYTVSESKIPYHFPAPKWWSLLVDNPEFKLASQKRWLILRKSLLSDLTINSSVDSLSRSIPPSAIERNFNTYQILGKRIPWAAPPQKTYQEEINYLKKYMNERAKWMDINLSRI